MAAFSERGESEMWGVKRDGSSVLIKALQKKEKRSKVKD